MEYLQTLSKLKSEIINMSFVKAQNIINDKTYKKVMCSISGGSDSDVILDIVHKVDESINQIDFFFFDTGLEYEATKKHLDELEEKYKIQIRREKPKMSIPLACKTYGVPFLSKWISECIHRLQNHKFEFKDESFEVLLNKHCKELSVNEAFSKGKLKKGVSMQFGKYWRGCVSALRWWCNQWGGRFIF